MKQAQNQVRTMVLEGVELRGELGSAGEAAILTLEQRKFSVVSASAEPADTDYCH